MLIHLKQDLNIQTRPWLFEKAFRVDRIRMLEQRKQKKVKFSYGSLVHAFTLGLEEKYIRCLSNVDPNISLVIWYQSLVYKIYLIQIKQSNLEKTCLKNKPAKHVQDVMNKKVMALIVYVSI